MIVFMYNNNKILCNFDYINYKHILQQSPVVLTLFFILTFLPYF